MQKPSLSPSFPTVPLHEPNLIKLRQSAAAFPRSSGETRDWRHERKNETLKRGKTNLSLQGWTHTHTQIHTDTQNRELPSVRSTCFSLDGVGRERKVWNCGILGGPECQKKRKKKKRKQKRGIEGSRGGRKDPAGCSGRTFNCRTRDTFKAGCKWSIKLARLIYERWKFLGPAEGWTRGPVLSVCESSKVILFSWRRDRQAAMQAP